MRGQKPQHITVYSQELTALSNIIHRTRHAFGWEMEDITLNLDCSPVPVTAAEITGNMRYLTVTIGAQTIIVAMPYALTKLILDNFGDGQVLCDDSDLAPLLLTLSLEPAIEEIENALQSDVDLMSLSNTNMSALPHSVMFSAEIQGQSYKIPIFCDLEGMRLLSQLLSGAQLKHNHLSLKTLARFQIGKTRLSVEELKLLEHGDIIVLDNKRIDLIEIKIDAGLRFQGQIDENGNIHVVSQPQFIRLNPMDDDDFEDFTHDNAHAHDEHSVDTTLGGLHVTVSFELGRLPIAFEDLSSIAQGYIFSLPATNPGSVTILANGQPVGKGEIARVGDVTGVRVTRLFGH